MSVLTAALAWGRRNPIAPVLICLFLAAILVRAAPVIRLDYAPWWDGVGYGYADLWTGEALRLAGGDFAALSFYSEGLLFVPAQAMLFKFLGVATGMHAWAVFLVLVSAAIVPIAAHTVYLITRQPIGALAAGVLTIFDPVSAWYGTNGWSDAQTFLSVALACWAFVLCARKPTYPRLLLLGAVLATLALGHTTWLYPATLWALMAPILLATRKRWFPSPLDLPHPGGRGRWLRRIAVPASFFAIGGFIMISLIGAGGAIRAGAEGAGPFNVDRDNQRALVVTYDRSIEWDDWTPADTIRVVLRKFPPRIPELVTSFVRGHIANAVHLYRWVLLATMVATAIVIAGRRQNPWPSRWGFLGLAIPGYFLLFEPGTEEPAVALTYLTVGALWMYLPIARILMVLFGPIFGILILYLPLTTQPRHSNAIVFLLILLAAIAIGLAADQISRWYRDVGTRQVMSGQTVLVSAGLIVLIGVGLASTTSAIGERRAEDRYLAWFGSQVGEDALVITVADVDPWQVLNLTNRPVIYDVENGARLAIEPGGPEWGNDLIAELRSYGDEEDVFRALEDKGYSLWFYAPWQGAEREWFEPNFAGSGPRGRVELVGVADYPERRGRAALMVGR